MKRRSQDEGQSGSARIAEESGFTMVELLVTMFFFVLVLAAGTYGLSLAFHQSTQVSARVSTSSKAEVGLQQLTDDLRTAVACPSYTSAGYSYYPGVTSSGGVGGWTMTGASATYGPVTGIYIGGTSTYPILAMCDPAPGSAAMTPPQDALVIWNCQQATELCTRTWQTIPLTPSPANQAFGASQASTRIFGVSSLALTGLTTGPTAVSLSTGSYALATGVSGATPLSWVGITGQFFNLVNPNIPSSPANLQFPAQTSITVTTGADLRNYGT